MHGTTFKKRSIRNFLLLLLALSVPIWVLGSIYHVELLPGFNLYQLGLGMPAVAALILLYREGGTAGVLALLKRTYDLRKIAPKIWYLPVLLIYPSMGFLNYWIQRLSGTPIPPPHFSWIILLAYSTVFFLTFGEELGLTGYAMDPMLERYSALKSGIFLGLIWAGYHIPGFLMSGFYSMQWIFWHAIYTVAGRVLFVWVYNNAGKSLFSMALMHTTFGLFWVLWPPTDNLQKAVSYYDPRIAAFIAISYVLIVTLVWGPRTLAQFRFARQPGRIPSTADQGVNAP
jgi:CAAX protease family protein